MEVPTGRLKWGDTTRIKLLSDHGNRVQQSRKGNCWDNAPTESFFGKPKVEWVHGVDYADHDEANMKRISTIFLQGVIMLIGIGALAIMLWEPHVEGRNAHATK